MKTISVKPSNTGTSGFTLIEMIGVIAIMSILAAILAPNALRSLDRAAISAEAETLHNLGEQVKLSFRSNGWIPGMKPVVFPAIPPSWDQDIGSFADMNSVDILTNKRQIARVYVIEPAILPAVPTRALLLSSMRSGVPLGPAATAAAFTAVWNWNTSDLVASPPPAGWAAWNTNNIEFLVIERVSVQAIYMTIKLTNNSTTTDAGFRIVPAFGLPPLIEQKIPAKTAFPPVTLTMRPKEQLNLYNVYSAVPGPMPDYSYAVSSGSKVFDFTDATKWVPQ
jgi:prepilin-type N-terminal cleavage/methylation domain-containing protein